MAQEQALTIVGRYDLTPMEQHAAYLEEKRALIRDTIAYDEISDAGFDFFIEVCKLRGLNPLAGQINCIKRGGKASFEPTIDGFRLIASRTGKSAGADPYVFTFAPDGHPETATATIYRMVEGQRCPFSYTVYWDERCPRNRAGQLEPINLWVSAPRNMLGKCAETGALRQAFPEECGGLYGPEEMEQADLPARPVRELPPPTAQRPAVPPPSTLPPTRNKARVVEEVPAEPDARPALLKKMWALAVEYYGDRDKADTALHEWIKVSYPDALKDDKPSIRALTADEMQEIITAIESSPLDADIGEAPSAQDAHLKAIAAE